jgi:hypothetical protein
MRAATLLLIGLATAGAGEPMEQAPRHAYSLVIATWPTDLPRPPCEGEVVCDVVVTKVRFADLTTVAGPRVPEALTLHLGWHGAPPPGQRFLAAVWLAKGQWRAHWVGDFGAEDCVSADTLSEYRIALPPQARRKGDEICFRP